MRSAYDTISTAADQAPGLLSQPALAQVCSAPVGAVVADWQRGRLATSSHLLGAAVSYGYCLHLQIILPPLFGKLDTLPDGDRELLPLMECLTAGACMGTGKSLSFSHCAYKLHFSDACSPTGLQWRPSRGNRQSSLQLPAFSDVLA